jgi:predicted anti-sigma-YlaC factor YlaD
MAGETTVRCERARQWAALALDDELSELESRLLARHLDTCSACADWAAAIGGATDLLRADPLESPAGAIALGEARRDGRSPLRRRLAVAAVAVAAAVGTLVGALLTSSNDSPSVPAPQIGFLNEGDTPGQGPAPREQVTPDREPNDPENPREDPV